MPTAIVLRVLILDDEPDSADSLAILVRLCGHEPLVAYAGQAALELAARRPPDVALLNLAMPGLTGFDVARRLRQRPELDTTPLVAVTGYADTATRRRAFEAGFEAVLVKPVDPPALEALLQQFAAQAMVRTTPMVKKTKKLPTTRTQTPVPKPEDAKSSGHHE